MQVAFPRRALSARKIAKLTKRGRYPDGRVPGLYFQISKTGGRSWVLRYSLDKRERTMGLGRATLVSVDYARERARAAWKKIVDGVDPLAGKRGAASANPATLPFAQACALAHTLDSKTEAAYQRGDLLLRRRKLMEAWTNYCSSPVRSGDVVPIRKVAT